MSSRETWKTRLARRTRPLARNNASPVFSRNDLRTEALKTSSACVSVENGKRMNCRTLVQDFSKKKSAVLTQAPGVSCRSWATADRPPNALPHLSLLRLFCCGGDCFLSWEFHPKGYSCKRTALSLALQPSSFRPIPPLASTPQSDSLLSLHVSLAEV